MPSFTSLRSVQVLVESDNLKIHYGAQAVSVTSQGAFTGDVSADMIAHLGCSYVIVGHSERRKYHPEDDANIVDQVRAVLAAKMQPILCVGESYEERRKGIAVSYTHLDVYKRQTTSGGKPWQPNATTQQTATS